MLIYASDVAAAVGRHKYKPAWQVFDSMWQRLQREQYDTCVATYAQATRKRKQQLLPQVEIAVQAHVEKAKVASTVGEVAALTGNAQASVTEVVKQQVQKVWGAAHGELATQVQACQTAEDVRKLVEDTQPLEVVNKLEQTAQLLEVKTELLDKVKSDVQCTFGTHREQVSRDHMVATGVVAAVKYDNKFHVMWMEYPLTTSGTKWGVGGRVDGVDEEGRVVEIKNRARRFFPTVPDYELVQVQTYMALLDADETVFVQQLNGQQRSTVIQRDLVMWQVEIVPKLHQFMNLLDLFLADDSEVMRQEWARSSNEEKERVLHAWLQEPDTPNGDYVF